MKVVDVMTESPLTVTPAESVGRADELMTEHGIRQLPVVEGKELIGVITDRDIRSVLSSALLLNPDARNKALKTLIRNVMTSAPITLSPNDDLKRALKVLIDEKVGGIPVVDRGAGLLGIVTYIDLLRCCLNRIRED